MLVAGEDFLFGFQDDGLASPVSLDDLLPPVVVQAVFVHQFLCHTQVLTEVAGQDSAAVVKTLEQKRRITIAGPHAPGPLRKMAENQHSVN